MKIFDKNSPIDSSVTDYAKKEGFSEVIVTLSGGADSVATTFALLNAGINLKALHANFHLRGDESNRDMEFVKEFCFHHNLSLEIKEFDIPRFLEENKGLSIEMACRELRHSWFRERLDETNFQRIATGHNADDNIETFFLNILRGSGTRGLKGMEYDTGVIWRPLLNFHRKDILEYLKKNSLSYVVDSTNLECDYRRNILRNKIIPLFKENWKGFDKAVDKTIKNISEENHLVENILQDILINSENNLNTTEILSSPSPLLLIKRFIDKAKPFSTTPQEIYDAIIANKPHIRQWKLKNGTVYLRNKKLFVEMSHGESGS